MQYGSHIRVWRGCYYYHGIIVGNGQVIIHFSLDVRVLKMWGLSVKRFRKKSFDMEVNYSERLGKTA